VLRPAAAQRALSLLPGTAQRLRLGKPFSSNLQGLFCAVQTPAALASKGLGTHSVFPPPLKPCRRQLGVADRVLDVLVPEVRLQRSGISAGIRLVEAASVSEHVRVHLDFELGGLASPVDELLEV